MKTAITIYAPAFLEKLLDFFTIMPIFIRLVKNCFLIIVTASGNVKICQQHRQCILFLQGADDHCLFTVCEFRQIDAGVFFNTSIVSFRASTSSCSFLICAWSASSSSDFAGDRLAIMIVVVSCFSLT